MLGYVFGCSYVCVLLVGIVHIVLMSIYNLTNTCINLKSERLVWLRYELSVALLVGGYDNPTAIVREYNSAGKKTRTVCRK